MPRTEDTIGQHDEAVRCLIRSKEHNFIISGSWDQEISIWDPRQRNRIVSRPQNERVYAMDCVDNTLVVGTAQRKFLIWDLRNWGKFLRITVDTFSNFPLYLTITLDLRKFSF